MLLQFRSCSNELWRHSSHATLSVTQWGYIPLEDTEGPIGAVRDAQGVLLVLSRHIEQVINKVHNKATRCIPGW